MLQNPSSSITEQDENGGEEDRDENDERLTGSRLKREAAEA